MFLFTLLYFLVLRNIYLQYEKKVVECKQIKQAPERGDAQMSNNVTFEVIKKNGKPFMRMTSYGTVTDMKIYKANTDRPYVRYLGRYIYLDDDMKKAL